jgi:hypothetical protein
MRIVTGVLSLDICVMLHFIIYHWNAVRSLVGRLLEGFLVVIGILDYTIKGHLIYVGPRYVRSKSGDYGSNCFN